MNLNIFSLEHFIIWRNEFFKGKTLPIIRPDYIENPVFLQAHYLPDKVKEQAVASLQRIVGLGCDEEKILAADMLEQVRAEPSDKLEKLAQLKNYLIDIDIRRRMDHKLIWDWL